MFYRRKVILSLLQSLGGELSKTDFQKHLFLLTRLQDAPSYDFVPHHYGCFSFGLMPIVVHSSGPAFWTTPTTGK